MSKFPYTQNLRKPFGARRLQGQPWDDFGFRQKSFNVRHIASVVKGPWELFHYKHCQVLVIGTAHISQQSVDDVQRAIDKLHPDVIGVELCEARHASMTQKNRWRDLDIVQVIKQKKIYLLFSSLILSSFQKRMGEMTRVPPGAELKRAVDLARQKNKPLELIDRDVQVTLRRTWQSVGYFSKIWLMSSLLAGLLFKDESPAADIEQMKTRDVLDDLFSNIPRRYHSVRDVIITERDIYLGGKIKQAISRHPHARRMVAVVGAGHLKGIKKHFYQEHDLKPLEYVRPKSKLVAFLKFIAPIMIIMGLFYLFSDNDISKASENIITWIWIKAACSAFFPLVMRAHPLAILGSALTGPIANFNPVLKPGWVTALIEAGKHKPQVADFENLARDTETFSGLWNNKVMRIFFMFFMPQMGSFIGTVVALKAMA